MLPLWKASRSEPLTGCRIEGVNSLIVQHFRTIAEQPRDVNNSLTDSEGFTAETTTRRAIFWRRRNGETAGSTFRHIYWKQRKAPHAPSVWRKPHA